MQREDERQRAHEVRRDPLQHGALAQGLEHQPEVAVLEIADAAVHQAARPAAGAPGQVALLQQDGAQAAQGGVPRDAGPRDGRPR